MNDNRFKFICLMAYQHLTGYSNAKICLNGISTCYGLLIGKICLMTYQLSMGYMIPKSV